MADRLELIRKDHGANRWFGGGAKHDDVRWLLDEVERLRGIVRDLAEIPTVAWPDDDYGAICDMCNCDNLHPDSGTVEVEFPGTAMLAPFTARHHRQCPWVRARDEFPEARTTDTSEDA